MTIDFLVIIKQNFSYLEYYLISEERTRAHKITSRPTDFLKNFPSRNDV